MLREERDLDEEDELKIHLGLTLSKYEFDEERWYKIETADCNEKEKITNVEIDRRFDLWEFCCLD